MSVRRACGFAGLAIFTVVAGLSFHPAMAARAGAILTGLLAAILMLQARRAPLRPYRRTEVWIMLDRKLDLPDAIAQQAIGQALRDSYLRHAEIAAGASALFWLVAIMAALLL